MVGLDNPSSHMDRLRRGHGLLSWSLELGLGRRGDAVCATGARRRPYATYCRILSGADCDDGGYGVGVGCGGVGGHEVFSPCEGLGWGGVNVSQPVVKSMVSHLNEKSRKEPGIFESVGFFRQH